MARKNEYTPQQMIDALTETKGLVSLAAKKLGCSPQTIFNYRDKYPEVAIVFENQRSAVLDIAELSLFKAIQKGEQWATTFALRTIGKHRGYVERTEVENSGDMQITVKYETD